jgi:hypothetical protein
LISTAPLQAATEQRIALVIGNGAYDFSPLRNPVNDAADMAASLKHYGFSVVLRQNAGHQEMEEAIREFGDQLKKGGVGLFYYAGHGVQIGGRNYLLPVGAKINKEIDIKFQAVDTELVLAEMSNAGNPLNIVILDACRDNPFGRSFRTASRGLAVVSDAPKGTFITYSTSPGRVAADGSGRNSPYTESLIRHMSTPGLPIEEIFKNVRRELSKKTGGQQIPWELSSLEGYFFFNPAQKDGKEAGRMAPPVPSTDYESDKRLEIERQKLQQERDLLEQRRALLEQEKQLQDGRKIIEDEPKKQSDPYIGCFKDDQKAWGIFGVSLPGRDINGLTIESNNLTNDLCISVCKGKGFSYAGTQYSTQCFCGNSYGSFGKSDHCDMECAGNPSQICGGRWANSVYQVK